MRDFRAFPRLGRLSTWRELTLNLGAILGLLCIVTTIATVAFGIKPLVFRSGSMSPAIGTGALAFAKSTPAADLSAGDIVSVNNAKGTRVTHRISLVEPQGAGAVLTLKGDANRVADAEPYVVRSADRVFLSVPKLGYVVSWMSGPLGTFAAGLFIGLILLLAFRRERTDPPTEGPREGERRATKSALALVVGIGLFGSTSLSQASPTWASWTDSATATSGTLTAHTVLPPVSVTCTGGGLGASLTFVWPNKDVRYRYRVTVEKPAGTIVSTSFVANNGTAGTNQSHVLALGLLGSLLGVSSTFTVRVRSEATGAPTWVSATGPTDTGTFTLGVLTSC